MNIKCTSDLHFPINKTREEFCDEMCQRELELLAIIVQNSKDRLEKKLIISSGCDSMFYTKY